MFLESFLSNADLDELVGEGNGETGKGHAAISLPLLLQAILSQHCPMETRMHATQKLTREFPLGEDSDEEPGSEE